MDVDYLQPTIYHQSDYRTSSSRAHRFKLSNERNFIPLKSHSLCSELKNSRADYRPVSESTKEYPWKINPSRNFRAELAAPIEKVRYIHQFTDKMKADKLIKPLNLYKSRAGDSDAFTSLPREIKLPTTVHPPTIQHFSRETFHTNTAGYYPYLDNLVSTTELDFHKHKNYETAKTNLIAQKELPFNSKVAFFTPKTKLIAQYPMYRKYDAKMLCDNSKFTTKVYDRITLMRTRCREVKSEMASSY